MTSLQLRDNIDDCVEALLRQIAKGAERRDEIIEAVSQTVADSGSLSLCVESLRAVSRRTLLSFVDNSAGLARTIAVSASLAERSSRRVKRLDVLLRRVREAKTIADALREMRRTVSLLTRAVDDGDVERTVALVGRYETASARLGGRVPSSLLRDGGEAADDDGGDVASTDAKRNETAKDAPGRNSGDEEGGGGGHLCHSRRDVEEIIASARESAREKLLATFRTASRENDKAAVMQATRLITQLGFCDEGCSLYCVWMCEHTIAALKKMVERELRKMDDPNEAAMSHLALVSTALDIVVAAFETEEEFALQTFGSAGVLKLLTELHSKSTTQCVPVLKDFLKKRQEVLCSVTTGGSTSAVDASGSRNNDVHSGAISSALYSPTAKTTTTMMTTGPSVDPRRTDQILEEMSHLVSCCHLYLTFAQSKQREYLQGVEQKGEQQQQGLKNDITVSADSLWSSQDNALMNTVQEILAVFVPLQKMYFDAAYEQVFQLHLETLHAAGKDAASSSAGGGGERVAKGHVGNPNSGGNAGRKNEAIHSPSSKKTATFMTGLAALYTSTTASGGTIVEDDLEQDVVYQQVSITLPDDIFFFLRIALHRAVNTKSTQIISAVFIACIELVQSKLIPVLELHVTLPPTAQLQQLQQKRPGHTVPLRVLRWTSAADCTVAYAQKLADELRQLARANFTGNDLLRFTEQAEDMDAVSRDLAASVGRWIAQFSEVCYQVYFAPHLERFSALSYNLTEDVFYHYELSDPWVRACVATAEVVLQPFDDHLGAHCFDKFLLALAQRVVSAAWRSLLQKTFSGYGALQVDREVRTLRAFFFGRAHEAQLRESFLPLSSAASLLMLDRPSDAERDAHEGLSADEKRAVLRCRVDFQRAEIASLRL